MDGTDPVRAWRSLCERMAGLAGQAAATGAAEGVRHLARQVALALEEQLEHADPRHPSFHRHEEPWSQWGAPNPDNVYLRTAIDPEATYRVWGSVSGVREVLISLVEGDMHLEEYGVYSERSLAELDVASDGTLEVVVSPDPHAGNWLPTDPKARMLMIRQYQSDWEHDAVTTFHIERVDTRGTPADPPEPADVAAALKRAAGWVERSLPYRSAFSSPDRGAPPNALGPPQTPPGGAPHIAYGAGRWSLAADEALVVTTDVPDADYWNWAAHTDHLFDTGDFASRTTSINHMQAHQDPDGRLRLVVAATDPGVPNWIDTSGRPTGMLAYRLIEPVRAAHRLSVAQQPLHRARWWPSPSRSARQGRGTRARHLALPQRRAVAIARHRERSPPRRAAHRAHRGAALAADSPGPRSAVERPSGHPRRPVVAPVFVTGLGRSGTSILHELLAVDPANRTALTWELLHPAEAASGDPDVVAAARRAGDLVHSFWADVQPEYDAMHHNAGDLPNEDIIATAHEFLSDQWSGSHVVPTYAMHLATSDQTDAYRYHRRILQTLQGSVDSTRWVLKAPSHLATFATLFEVYPDAQVVQIHRDPLKTVPSVLSLLGTLKWIRCDRTDLEAMAPLVAAGSAAMLDRAIADRGAGRLPDDQFVDVRYADLIEDPGAAVAGIYERLGWDADDAVEHRVRDYVARKPKGAHGEHRYSLDDFGLDPVEQRALFENYSQRFDVPAEV